MSRYFRTALMIVTLSLTVTSQPLIKQNPNKHSDFIWNSRKIGNKKVATLSIKKDEERDRRSITLAERYSNTNGNGHEWHPQRHHHGESVRTAMWLANEHRSVEHEGASPSDRLEFKGTSTMNFSPPLYVAESSVEDENRVRHNYVHPQSIQVEDHMLSFKDILQEAGISLNPIHLKTSSTNAKQSNIPGNGKKNSKKVKRNRNNRHKRKKHKGCRRLKGLKRRKCLNSLRQCRKLKRRKKKKCRSDALQSVLGQVSHTIKEDIFSFLKNMTEMRGKEACHYHHLKKCSTRVGLFAEGSDSNIPVVKCHFRKEFIKCIQNLQQRETCDRTFHMRGDMTTLRKRIKEFVWTPSSCLISDVEGSMQE